jgi:hypothetical protein
VLKEKQPHDVADVLLSLKHAVVHPGQLSPCGNFAGSYSAGQQCSAPGPYQGPSASLSYTVHPHQVRSGEVNADITASATALTDRDVYVSNPLDDWSHEVTSTSLKVAGSKADEVTS